MGDVIARTFFFFLNFHDVAISFLCRKDGVKRLQETYKDLKINGKVEVKAVYLRQEGEDSLKKRIYRLQDAPKNSKTYWVVHYRRDPTDSKSQPNKFVDANVKSFVYKYLKNSSSHIQEQSSSSSSLVTKIATTNSTIPLDNGISKQVADISILHFFPKSCYGNIPPPDRTMVFILSCGIVRADSQFPVVVKFRGINTFYEAEAIGEFISTSVLSCSIPELAVGM
jgi:hypothetical protein